MTWVDYTVLTILGVSVIMSIVHGLVRELMSLASWVVSFLVAQHFASQLAPLLQSTIAAESLRLLAAFVAVFLGVMIVMTFIAVMISGLMQKVGLGIVDRLLGGAFGFLRGVAIVLVAVLLAGLTSLPRHPAWRNAVLSPPLVMLANLAKTWLPYELSRHINYG